MKEKETPRRGLRKGEIIREDRAGEHHIHPAGREKSARCQIKSRKKAPGFGGEGGGAGHSGLKPSTYRSLNPCPGLSISVSREKGGTSALRRWKGSPRFYRSRGEMLSVV